jgi:hypothetical protein
MPDSVAAYYQVRLKNTAGSYVAYFDHFQSLEFQKIVNDVGYYALTFGDDGDSRFDLFQLDGQVEVWRSVPGVGLDWYREYEGFHRRHQRNINQDGSRTYLSYGVGYNDFLARTAIAYKGGTIRADKNAPAETVMKEFVDENCTPTGDTTVVGRLNYDSDADVFLYNSALPGLVVQPSSGQGIVWTGSRPFENLLDVLQEIADYSSIDFAVVGTGPATFAFITYVNQLGSNRTAVGLQASGTNAAGFPPVIFSNEYGNVQNIEYLLDRVSEANAVIVLGEGDGSTREVLTRSSGDVSSSPWNRREVSRPTHIAQIPGLSEEAAAELKTFSMQQTGDEVLEEMQAKEVFSFSPLQQPATLYGKNYFLGDRVTVRYGDLLQHKRITSVRVTVQEGGEVIDMELARIPKR